MRSWFEHENNITLGTVLRSEMQGDNECFAMDPCT